jgi:adenylyltransferase/sulfurtransferase
MQFGEEGQVKLKNARVFIAGAGGLGCPVVIYLAAAGIGKIRIVDRDKVEMTNLNRQILHCESDIGRKKTDSVEEKLKNLNSEINIEGINADLNPDNIEELVGDFDLIIDALDNFETRYLLNKVAIKKRIPLIHGAIRGFDGQATTIVPGKSPCLRCLFPHSPPAELFPVVGVTPGIIGLLQANEAIKYILGMDELLTGRLLLWNGMRTETETIHIARDKSCPDCGGLW